MEKSNNAPKICVYTIAKNEMKFIDRWFNAVKEADYVCVLDTGSTDGSYEKFLSLDIICAQKCYKNFRFDVARNDSLKLIPADTEICFAIDIDEYPEVGWSKILKENWNKNIGRVRYRYTWNFNPDGSEGTVFMADKIHKFGAYHWEHPVHEILVENTYVTSKSDDNVDKLQTNAPTKSKNQEMKNKHISIENKNSIQQAPQNFTCTLLTIDLPQIQLNHKADANKSRSNYLPLLELSIKEHPENDRNTHYLAREYMFHSEYKKAIKMFEKHLSLPTANWDMERCASLRYIAHCYALICKAKQEKFKQEFENLKNKFENNNKNLNENNLKNKIIRYDNLNKNFKNNKKINKNSQKINKKLKINKNFNKIYTNNKIFNHTHFDDKNTKNKNIKILNIETLNKILSNKINRTKKYYFAKQVNFLYLAILTCNTAREAYFELALAYFENQNFCLSAVWFEEMLKIKNRELNYMSNPICWGAVPYDYLSMCYYHLGDFKSACTCAANALKFANDERIKNNLKIFTNLLNHSN